MIEQNIHVPYSLKGDPDMHTVQIPAGYISPEDLLTHVGYQLGMGDSLLRAFEDLLQAEFQAGADTVGQDETGGDAEYDPDWDSVLRIQTAEVTQYAPE